MIGEKSLREVIQSQRKSLEIAKGFVSREKELKPNPSFATVITGIRRCGKSTFLHQNVKGTKAYYLNLEDPRLEGFSLKDFLRAEEIFFDLYGRGGIYFFDEIQNVDGWEKFIRHIVDRKERVVVTGSNASLLSGELGTKLTGRHFQEEMFPFSFAEFISAKKEKASVALFEDYLFTGGFPEYIKQGNPEILHELLADIVMRDIAVRYGIRNTNMLRKLALYLISNTGKEFSYNSLKKLLHVKSVQSVIDYLFYLENSYIVFTVPKFAYSYKQQQMSTKKIYSIDNGFSTVNSVSFSKDKGRMLENIIFLHLRRMYKEIFYFQENKECDFVIKQKNAMGKAIQVCFELNDENQERELTGLQEAMDTFNIQEGLLLTYQQEDSFLIDDKKIRVKPVWKWLLER